MISLAIAPSSSETLYAGTYDGVFKTITTAPEAPTTLLATPGNAKATIRWTAPANDGGSPITGYTVNAILPGTCPDMPVEATCAATLASTCTAPPEATQCTVTGLSNGTTYTFRALATNAIGNSAPSSPVRAAPTATMGTSAAAVSAPDALANNVDGADVVTVPDVASKGVAPQAFAAAQPVPTLSQWALALLALLMAGLAGLRLRRATA